MLHHFLVSFSSHNRPLRHNRPLQPSPPNNRPSRFNTLLHHLRLIHRLQFSFLDYNLAVDYDERDVAGVRGVHDCCYGIVVWNLVCAF